MGEWRLSMTMIGVLFAISFVTFVVLMFIPAPYGRHVRPGWGPVIPARVSWIAMETPAVLVFAWAFFAGERWFHPRRSLCLRSGKCTTSIARSSFRSERTAGRYLLRRCCLQVSDRHTVQDCRIV
jgi:hypothetical protein